MKKITFVLFSLLFSVGLLSQDPTITSFTLVDANSNEDIREITEGVEINLSAYLGITFNIRANTSDAVGSVTLSLSGPLTKTMTESVAPYALFGDFPVGDYNGEALPIGSYTITGTPYSEASAGGAAGETLSFNFQLVSEPLQRPFVTTWKTDNPGSSGDTQITIPTFEGEVYDYTVNWGDGSSDTNVTGDITHTYSTAGTYQVSILGEFPSIFFNDPFNRETGDGDKILSIDQWGDLTWKYLSVAFAGCDNLDIIATDVPDFSNVQFTNAMFHSCTSLVGNESMELWDFSSTISMNSMFYNAPLFNQGIGQWNTSKVTDFTLIFGEAKSFNQDLSNWNVSNAQNMNGMFAGAISFDQDLGNWNVENVTELGGIFNNVTLSAENYDALLKGWANQQVQNNLSFDGGNSQYCLAEEARQKLIDDFGWTITDGGKAEDCEEPQRPFITTWKTDNPGVSENNQITIPTFPEETYDYTVDWGDGMSNTGVIGDITHTYESPGTYQVSISGDFPAIYFGTTFPAETDDEKILSINQWGDIKWKSMSKAFEGCRNMDVLATDIPDMSRVERMNRMFVQSGVMGNSTFNKWDTSNVIDMSGVFILTSFNQDISSWDVSNVLNMNSMFALNTSFNQNISNWNVSKVEDMAGMFYEAWSFNQPIGSWNVTRVVNMNQMFGETRSFNQDITSWDVSGLKTANGMFEGETAFDQNIGLWNIENVTDLDYLFNRGAISQDTYDDILQGWSTQKLQPNIILNMGQSRFCEAENARQKLIDEFGWTIKDGGKLYNCNLVLEGEAELVEATYLQGATNPKPKGPLLRVEKGKRETYLKYDLSSFAGRITEARLEMKVASDPGNGNLEVFLGENSDWTESGLSGDNRPMVSGNALATSEGIHLLDETKVWNLDVSSFATFDELTLIVKQSTGNDVAFASDETSYAPKLVIRSTTIPLGQRPFITIWKTDNPGNSANNQITIPTFPGEVYDYTVEWGDGTSDDGVSGDITHTYERQGIYQVSIFGRFPRIAFTEVLNEGEKLLSVNQWGDIEWESMSRAFETCQNMDVLATDIPNLSKVEEMDRMFAVSGVQGNDIFNEWDISNVENLKGMFFHSSFNQDISDWDVQNVKDMSLMFAQNRFFDQDISNWKVGAVQNMGGMFFMASNFNQNLGNWNVSEVRNFHQMLEGVNLSVENYDKLLIGWSNNILVDGRVIVVNNSQYCLGEAARQKIIDDFGWTITDGGKATDCSLLVEGEADLIHATYLQGANNPQPNGPLLRVEQGIRETYLKFDLSDFSGIIAEARLEMQVASDPGNGTVEVFLGSSSNWTETGLNGANKPIAVGVALAAIGGSHAVGQTKIWNLDVSSLAIGGELTLIVKQTSGNDVAFASDETVNAPRLVVTTTSDNTLGSGANLSGILTLSPNPAVNDVRVSFVSPEGVQLVNDIRVYDTTGRLVRTVSSEEADIDGVFEINIRSLESGIYFIRSIDENGVPYQKQMAIKR